MSMPSIANTQAEGRTLMGSYTRDDTDFDSHVTSTSARTRRSATPLAQRGAALERAGPSLLAEVVGYAYTLSS